LAAAFIAATGDTTLQAWGTVLPSPVVNVNSSGTVNFNGGYDAFFGPSTGMTAMQGVLTIQQGALVVDRLTIQ
jgi:hypothetical protein